MTTNWSGTTDTRDTGEHFLGALDQEPDGLAQISARRLADLATQIDFLDREVARYRELLEHERIRHSTELADLQLEADTRLDELRREERHQTQALHDSYRALLSERQIDFENALSAAASASASDLADERRRHQEILDREHSRRDAILEASRRQAIEEINEANQRARQELEIELAQATDSRQRLQDEIHTQMARADHAEAKAAQAEKDLAAVQRRLERVEAQQQLRVQEAEKQAAAAISRLESERKRSAATLAELLERSASIAAEADKARSDFAAEQAKAEHAAATALQRAQAEYRELAQAADVRAGRAIEREIELEAAIAELREQSDRGKHQ